MGRAEPRCQDEARPINELVRRMVAMPLRPAASGAWLEGHPHMLDSALGSRRDTAADRAAGRRLRCPIEPAPWLARAGRAVVCDRRSSQSGPAPHGAAHGVPAPCGHRLRSHRRVDVAATNRPSPSRHRPIRRSPARMPGPPAITAAVDALGALRSYRMSVDVVGLDLAGLQPASFDVGVRGTVTHTSGLAIDAQVGVRMREPNGSAAITSGAQYVMGDGYVWGMDNLSEVLEPSSDATVVSSMVLLSPEGLAARAIAPFAGGYRRIGIETHGGTKVVHYRADRGGAGAYADVFNFPGTIAADLWIAATGGELVGARVAGTSSHRDPWSGADVDDSVLIAFEVTDRDSATNVVVLPHPPVADPVRPSGPPVDLKLEYQVMPSDGTQPDGGRSRRDRRRLANAT